MNFVNITKENIIANTNGFIMTDYKGSYTASFLADIPKSAVVDHIKVGGKFLEDINTKKKEYHLEPTEKSPNGTWRVAATVWFEEDDLDFYFKLANYEIQDFEIYYHLEAIIEK